MTEFKNFFEMKNENLDIQRLQKQFPQSIITITQVDRQHEMNGMSRTYDTDGNLRVQASYKRGKLNGKSETFYADGTVRSVKKYINSELVGNIRHFHGNGVVASVIPVRNGEMHGRAMHYNNAGTLRKIEVYDNGNVDAEKTRQTMRRRLKVQRIKSAITELVRSKSVVEPRKQPIAAITSGERYLPVLASEYRV